MANTIGRSRPLSLTRTCIGDFLHVSGKIPTVAIERKMNVSRLVAARTAASPRPGWCGIFTKAYAIAAARMPELRLSYLGFPYARLYEHPTNITAVVVESQLNDETIIVPVLIHAPENRTLLEFDERIAAAKADPVGNVKTYRHGLMLARLPTPLRRLAWWYTHTVSGREQERWLGTFGVSSVASMGADTLNPRSPWPTLLHYGVIAADGTIAMRLTFDHRILDAATPARGLQEMERALHDVVLPELVSLSASPAQDRHRPAA